MIFQISDECFNMVMIVEMKMTSITIMMHVGYHEYQSGNDNGNDRAHVHGVGPMLLMVLLMKRNIHSTVAWLVVVFLLLILV